MPLFTKRLTLEGVTSGLSKVVADLSALQVQNDAEVSKNAATIATLNTTNAQLVEEAKKAAAVASNIEKLLSV